MLDELYVLDVLDVLYVLLVIDVLDVLYVLFVLIRGFPADQIGLNSVTFKRHVRVATWGRRKRKTKIVNSVNSAISADSFFDHQGPTLVYTKYTVFNNYTFMRL